MDTYPYVSILLEYHKSIWWLPQAGRGPWPTAIKIALFVRTTRNLRNPLKDWKFYVALFCWPPKRHTRLWLFYGKLNLALVFAYWHFPVDLHCNIRVLPSFFSQLIFAVKPFPQESRPRVHFSAFLIASSIFLGTTPYCLRINCRRFTTSDSLLEGTFGP